MYKYTHTRLLVTRFAECFRFYRDVLGFKVTWGKEDERYAEFDTGNTKISLFDRKVMSAAIGETKEIIGNNTEDSLCLVFAVDDVDKAYKEVDEKGTKCLTQPKDYKDWGIRAFHLRDPQGNLIEINKELN